MLSKSSKRELGFVHYIAKFTILRFVISRFECTTLGEVGRMYLVVNLSMTNNVIGFSQTTNLKYEEHDQLDKRYKMETYNLGMANYSYIITQMCIYLKVCTFFMRYFRGNSQPRQDICSSSNFSNISSFYQ